VYLFFYIRKSSNDKKTGTIYRAVYENRTPIIRESLKISVPINLWDEKKQRVKENDSINYQHINYTLNQLQAQFLQSNQKETKTSSDCFIEFSMGRIISDYDNVGTKKKYRTIIKSLQKYVNEILMIDSLPIKEFRKIDFIPRYSKWLEISQSKRTSENNKKKNRTVFNYLVVIQTFVKKFNQTHPELDEIKTIHYTSQIGKFDKVESRMLYPHEIDRLINYVPDETKRRKKSIDAKYHFLFQFFTNGLRVSDILLLNYKHFTNGRIEFVVKKNGNKISIPFGFKSCKILSHFYPDEYNQAVNENLIGDLNLYPSDLNELIMISSKKDLGLLNIEDLQSLKKYLKSDKDNDNEKKLIVLNSISEKLEQGVSNSMCKIMGAKPSGLVFDYLEFEEFKNLKIMDKRELTEEQSQKLHRGRCQYNSRLKKIASDIGIEKLTSHVSRHSFAYYMLLSGSKIEEISFALLHSNIEQTQGYLLQFPSKFSDNAIKRFTDGFDI